MTIRKFRLFCLWSPIWLGAAMGVVVAGHYALVKPLVPSINYPDWIIWTVFAPIFPAVFGGLQYIAALLIFFRFVNIEYTKSYIIGLTFLPLYFTILQIFGMLVVLAAIGDLDLEDRNGILFFLPVNLAVGYAYVAIWVVAEAAVAIYKRTCATR